MTTTSQRAVRWRKTSQPRWSLSRSRNSINLQLNHFEVWVKYHSKFLDLRVYLLVIASIHHTLIGNKHCDQYNYLTMPIDLIKQQNTCCCISTYHQQTNGETVKIRVQTVIGYILLLNTFIQTQPSDHKVIPLGQKLYQHNP